MNGNELFHTIVDKVSWPSEEARHEAHAAVDELTGDFEKPAAPEPDETVAAGGAAAGAIDYDKLAAAIVKQGGPAA